MVTVIEKEELDNAETALASLLGKCEKALENSTLSPGRVTLMERRIAALKTALTLIKKEQESEL